MLIGRITWTHLCSKRHLWPKRHVPLRKNWQMSPSYPPSADAVSYRETKLQLQLEKTSGKNAREKSVIVLIMQQVAMTGLVGRWSPLRPHAMASKITFPDRSTGCDSELHHFFHVLSSDMTLTNLGCPGQSYHMIVWDLWLAYCKMITELLWFWSSCAIIIKSWFPKGVALRISWPPTGSGTGSSGIDSLPDIRHITSCCVAIP